MRRALVDTLECGAAAFDGETASIARCVASACGGIRWRVSRAPCSRRPRIWRPSKARCPSATWSVTSTYVDAGGRDTRAK